MIPAWLNGLMVIGPTDPVGILVTLVTSLVLGYVIFRIIYTVLLRITHKTKVSLDEVLIHKSHRPVFLLIVTSSFYLAFSAYLNYSVFGITLDSVFSSVYIIILTYWAVHVFNASVDWYVKEIAPKTRTTFDDKFAPSLKKYVSFGIIIVGLLVLLAGLGIEITPLVASLGIGGLAVALALQDTFSNFIAGIHIVSDRVFEPGDWVKIGDVEGQILEVGWRSTRIRTWDNNLYTMPNKTIAESIVLDYSQPDSSTTLTLKFQTVYGVDVEKVKKVITQAALSVLKKDEYYVKDSVLVRFSKFLDSGLEFTLFFRYKDRRKRFNTEENIKIAVYKAFKKHKIDIPYPTYTVYLEK